MGFWLVILAIIVVIVVVKVIKNAKKKKEAEIELKEKAELICNELNKRGYKLSYGDVRSVGFGYYGMSITIWKGSTIIGEMKFGTYGSDSSCATSDGYDIQMGIIAFKRIPHIIHLDKSGILIKSEVPCSEPPPEWLNKCGQLLRSAGYTISYPEWMNKLNCPDATKYVNVVFQ